MMFILAEVGVVFFLWCATFKIVGGFMKCGVRNRTAGKRLTVAIFKLLVLSYMHTDITVYISFFYSKIVIKRYVL